MFGFLAWGRYSPIVPAGLYDQINVARNAIGTGPYRMVGFNPNDRVEYVANKNFWKKGQPYMDAMTLKTLHRRAGPHRGPARRCDRRRHRLERRRERRSGATATSSCSRAAPQRSASCRSRSRATRSRGTTSASGRRSTSRSTGRRSSTPSTAANGNYSGIVPPGYGPWPLTQAELKNEVPEVRPAEGQEADGGRRATRRASRSR